MEKNRKLSKFGVFLPFLILSFCQYLIILCCSLNLNPEGLALLKLKERVVSDPYLALNDWRNDDVEGVDPCSWLGVQCSQGKVVVLNLKDLCLRGTLAPELRNLLHLKAVILRNNSFTGTIPEGIGELPELEVMDIGYNNFSGPLPPDLGSSVSLTTLLLDNNELLGSLSPEIQQLKMLSEFQMGKNLLSNAAKGSDSPFDRKSNARTDPHTNSIAQKRQLTMIKDNIHFPETPPSPELSSSPPTIDDFGPIVVIPLPPMGSPAPPTTSPPAPPPSEPVIPSPTVNGSISPLHPAPTTAPANSPLASLGSSKGKHHKIAVISGAIGGSLLIIVSIIAIYLYRTSNATIKPWTTGLSGQLQKVFITGIPKLKRSELEAGCEDFSNVIDSSPVGTLYKGTLSTGVEIAVASVAVTSSKDWSKNLELQFRKKIETLSKVNHKNFVNILGYCEEEDPFTRMMVFEYAPNGTLFEHLHYKESEHLDWAMRLRIAMGMVYCLEHMHQLNPPVAHNNLTSSAVSLTEDYAAKISDFSFSCEIEASGSKNALDKPLAHPQSNVYSFGVILFEMVTGRLPFSVDNGSLEDWASDYLMGDQPLIEMLDPTLESCEVEKVERIGEVIKCCVHPDRNRRPAMREVSARLREITTVTPDAASPKLSPLWWAELEILSADANQD